MAYLDSTIGRGNKYYTEVNDFSVFMTRVLREMKNV